MKRIGLIGGLSCESTASYSSLLIDGESAPFPIVDSTVARVKALLDD
jgi:aspartate/glutamate racemase